ncbi:MAG: glycosyltransferase involved in cell wall biosynthesis [Candidatus Azotimanducaceae bacterium]
MINEKCPFFSIIVPTKNRPNVLSKALESISNQSFTDYEVIIVDDGSDEVYQEEVESVVKRFGSAFKLVKRPVSAPSHGPNVARNTGIEAALGKYVGFLDDDDYWCDENSLKVAEGAMSQLVGADFFLSDQVAKLEESVIVDEWLPYLNRTISKRHPLPGTDCYSVNVSDILKPEGIGFPSVNTSLVRRGLLKDIGGFWDGSPYEGDLNFSLRLLDRVNTAIYRPKVTAVNVLRKQSSLEGVSSIAVKSKQLYRMLVCEHANSYCDNKVVRAYIRLLHSGVLKTIVKEYYKDRSYSLAGEYALRAVAIDFSFKWVVIGAFLKLRGMLSKR